MRSRGLVAGGVPGALLVAAVVGLVGCGQRCADELLPGRCANSATILQIPSLTDAATLDLDGDGVDEIVAIDGASAQIYVFWGDGRRTGRPLDRVPEAIVAVDLEGDGAPVVVIASDDPASIDALTIEVDGAPQVREEIAARGGVRDLWAGDLDGDGVDELVTADAAEGTLTVIHGGDRSTASAAAGETPVAIDVGDLDGDGRPEVVVADFTGGAVTVLAVDEQGRPSATGVTPTIVGPQWLDLGDLDGDGDLDLAVRSGGAPEVWVHPGDGVGGLDPAFVLPLFDVSAVDPPLGALATRAARGVAALDASLDGVGGVIVPELGALSTWKIGAGPTSPGRAVLAVPGVAVDAILEVRPGERVLAGSLFAAPIELAVGIQPLEVWRAGNESDRERWRHLVVADVDGDGSDDFVVVHQVGAALARRSQIELYLGDGAGGFSLASFADDEASDALAIGDLDGDGALELLRFTNDALERCPLVDGALGDFAVVAGGGAIPSRRVRGLVRGDDGRSRILLDIDDELTGSAQITLLTVDGAPSLAANETLAAPGPASVITIVDLDGDDDDDLVFVSDEPMGAKIQAWTAASATYVPGPAHDLAALTGWAESGASSVGAGDLDDDGAVEILLVGREGIARVHDLAGGAPTAEVDATLGVDATASLEEVVVGDVDGDGAPDLLYVVDRDLRALHGEDGALIGPARALPLPTSDARVFRDLDGDGRIDVLVDLRSSVSALLMRDGAGPTIAPSNSVPSLAGARSGDMDGDGIDDVVVVGWSAVVLIRHPGQADQTFDRLDWTADDVEGLGFEVADLDGDGRDDLVLAGSVVRWRDGRLRLTPLEVAGEADPRPRRIGDLDGDGVADLVMAELPEPSPSTITWARGLGEDRFAAPVTVTEGGGRIDVADVNGDGLDDLLQIDGGDVVVHWSRRGGAFGRSTIEANDALPRPGRSGLLIRRGRELLMVAATGEGLGTPHHAADDDGLRDASLALAGDLDGDGVDDVISLGFPEALYWVTRGDEMILVGRSNGLLGMFAFGDFDGGGRSDLVSGFVAEGLRIDWGELR
ncbi:MAG: VCBS repeat-containing protein [Nannocystaceae bacterium]